MVRTDHSLLLQEPIVRHRGTAPHQRAACAQFVTRPTGTVQQSPLARKRDSSWLMAPPCEEKHGVRRCDSREMHSLSAANKPVPLSEKIDCLALESRVCNSEESQTDRQTDCDNSSGPRTYSEAMINEPGCNEIILHRFPATHEPLYMQGTHPHKHCQLASEAYNNIVQKVSLKQLSSRPSSNYVPTEKSNES